MQKSEGKKYIGIDCTGRSGTLSPKPSEAWMPTMSPQGWVHGVFGRKSD
jgi:hypothetical protein